MAQDFWDSLPDATVQTTSSSNVNNSDSSTDSFWDSLPDALMPKTAAPSFFSDVSQDVNNRASSQTKSLLDQTSAGKPPSIFEAGLQGAGFGYGVAKDIVGEAYKHSIPESFQNAISQLQSAGQAAGQTAGQVMQPVANAIDNALPSIGNSVINAKEYLGKNPNLQADIDAFGNIISGAPIAQGGANIVKNMAINTMDTLKSGANMASGAIFKSPQDVAMARMSRDFARDNISPEQAQSILENSPTAPTGEGMTLADIGSSNIQSLGRSVVNTPGIGREKAINTLVGRQSGTTDRVQNIIQGGFGTNAEFNDTVANLQKAKEDMATPLYQKAYEANQNVQSPAIDRILKTPAGQLALKTASIKMQNDMSLMGINDPDLVEQAKLTGQYQPTNGGIASGLKMRSLDYVKRALDDQIGTSIRAGENDNVRILSGLKNGLLRGMDEADSTAIRDKNGNIIQPGAYAQGRAAFSGTSQSQNALQMGRNFLNEDAETTAQDIANLDDGDKKFFQIGAARALSDKAAANPNATVKNILTNDLYKQRLQAALPSKNSYYDFLQGAQNEANKNSTKNAVLGNSTTVAQTIKNSEDNIPPAFGLNFGNIADALRGDFKGAVAQIGKNAITRMITPPDTSAQLSKMLFETNPAMNQQTIKAWQQYLQGRQKTPFGTP